jgi:hypothetical protein
MKIIDYQIHGVSYNDIPSILVEIDFHPGGTVYYNVAELRDFIDELAAILLELMQES